MAGDGGKLTALAIKAAKPGKHFDGGGLYLDVREVGRYWRLKYRFAGKEKLLALGVFPEVSLAEARRGREAARAVLRTGKDPSAERQGAKTRAKIAAANSFEAIAEEWLELRSHNWTRRQFLKEQARLVVHAYPWLGKTPIADLGVAEIRPILMRLVKKGHTDQAHRLRQELSRIFRHAIATERASRDPAHDLRDVLPAHAKRNYATITDPGRVGELLRAIEAFGGTFPVACALRLAPLLFARPGEIRAAEWSEIDLEHAEGARWVIPAHRRKLKKADKDNPRTPPHIVPLSAQAVSILRELKPLTGHGRYLFPGQRSPTRSISENTINAALRRIGYDRDAMTGHGFRHMASTLLNELGFDKDAIERQLSHKEPGVAGVYNKAEHLGLRTKMMQAWADYLDTLRQEDGKVVPIRSGIVREARA